ncbi:hypothetical protein HBB16_11120 [Pseudonocardia sp. MCCB 268]|nr:hypothetical protein [Pseudonocardia cytotoxica]
MRVAEPPRSRPPLAPCGTRTPRPPGSRPPSSSCRSAHRARRDRLWDAVKEVLEAIVTMVGTRHCWRTRRAW